jgi:NhaC family Na+:H+ antiporter
MFRDTYIKHKIAPVTLSATIADSGTIFSYIVPWNVNGAFAIGAMGVGLAYVPYAFLAYITPLVTIVLAFFYLNKKTVPADKDPKKVYGTEPSDAQLPSQRFSA